MKALNSRISNQTNNDVLFQKIANTWYVFSEINGEVIYSSLPRGMDPKSTHLELFEVIEEHLHKVSKYHRGQESVA